MKLPKFRKRFHQILSVVFALSLLTQPLTAILHPGNIAKAAEFLGAAQLTGVSCLDGGFCMSVGVYQNDLYKRPLVVLRQAGVWVQDSSFPRFSGNQNYILNTVDCVSDNFCMAVGQKENPLTDRSSALVMVYESGVWHEQEILGPWGLDSVSCVSRDFCMAGGWQKQANRIVSAAQIYSGEHWQSVGMTLSVGGNLTSSLKVDCISEILCSFSASYSKQLSVVNNSTYILGLYNHGQLSLLPLLDEEKLGAFESHDCVSLDYCMAASSSTQGFEKTLAQYSRGQWQQTPESNILPQGSIEDPIFNGISCIEVRQCIVVGSDKRAINSFELYPHGLVVLEVPTGWQSYIVEPPTAYMSSLSGLSCISSTNCVAVGGYDVFGQSSQALVATFDGTTWTTQNPLLQPFAAELKVSVNNSPGVPGSEQSVQASLVSDSANIVGREIRFEITAGPCKGLIKSAETNQDGQVNFIYTCADVGIDQIAISANLDDNGLIHELITLTQVGWRFAGPAYVAFGDSLTTGGSIARCKPDRRASPWGCTENPSSATPYPETVATSLGISLKRVGIWGYTAKEAAQAKKLGHNDEGDWQPQLNAIEDADQLVTGMLGVNDLRFSDIAFWAKKYYNPAGSQVIATAQTILNESSANFDQIFQSLAVAKNNGAQVVVALYYNPYDSPNRFCGDLKSIGNQLVDSLDNELIARAAQAEFQWADFRPDFRNHGSAAQDPYVFGTQCKVSTAIASLLPTWLGGGGGVEALAIGFDPHPNSKGTQIMAKAILREVET